MTRKTKRKLAKIIDAVFETIFYFGIVGIGFMLMFAPIFKPQAYYTGLLIAMFCASSPIIYLCLWAEWVSLKHNERNRKSESVQRI